MLNSTKSNSIWKISLHYNLSPTRALLYCFRYHFWHMLFCAYFLVVLFFMLNTITLAAAAAQSPHRDQYIFIGSHVVFGYLIQNQTQSRTRE